MSNDKQIIAKLLKVAETQQKVIQKIAQNLLDASQQSGATEEWEDVTAAVKPVLANAARAISAKNIYQIQSAEFGSTGRLLIKLVNQPSNDKAEFDSISANVKQLLLSKNINGKQIKSVDMYYHNA